MGTVSAVPKVVALSGGVGGAKLALGLSRILPAEHLSIVTNTADDFVHLGLNISPDIDTVMYTLAGINNRQQGWGLEGETWACMRALETLGGEHWFRLGDQDIATHLLRTEALKAGNTLTEVTGRLCQALGVWHPVLPMCDESVSTVVETLEGKMPFQQYFVRHQCRPVVKGFEFAGIETARLTRNVRAVIDAMDALVICPSNPFVSVAPILAVPGLRDALSKKTVPKIVVSPIVGGKALKGPAAKMMQELEMPCDAVAIANHYAGFGNIFVLDHQDKGQEEAIAALGYRVLVTQTVMKTSNDRIKLAQDILALLAGTAKGVR